jgi:ABC-type spermidine/putrescine transport system permease subunit I
VDRRLVEAAQDLYAGPWRPGGTIAGAVFSGALLGVLAYAFQWPYLPMIVGGALIGALVGTLFLSQSFLRVTLPLSLPGVFAGSLLVMIPAMGDYVNASLLGNTSTNMIGNVIQSRFLTNADYPTASALSFMLMAMILIAVTIYGRMLGTENLTSSRGL